MKKNSLDDTFQLYLSPESSHKMFNYRLDESEWQSEFQSTVNLVKHLTHFLSVSDQGIRK